MKVVKRWIWYVSGIFLLVFQIPNNFKVTIEKIENMRYIARPVLTVSFQVFITYLFSLDKSLSSFRTHLMYSSLTLDSLCLWIWEDKWFPILIFDIPWHMGLDFLLWEIGAWVKLDAPWGHRLAHIILVKSWHHLPGGCKYVLL